MRTAREQRIEDYAVLADPPGGELRDLVDLVAHVCDVPTAVINIVTRHQQHQIAATGFDPSVCAREDSMCALVLEQPAPVVVRDASLDERFASNAFVDGTVGSVRFYASAPLVTPDGYVLGRLCVFDDVPRDLSPRQHDALWTLARQVMDVLELRYRGKALEASLAELTAVRDELRRSNDHLVHFAGQVSHDLRSPLTVIIANAEILAGEPAVGADEQLSAMVESVSLAGQRMNRMIEEMLRLALEGGRLTLQRAAVADAVALVLADLTPVIESEGARVVVHELPTVNADPAMLYSILLNLLTNAIKFARPGVPAQIEVSAQRRGNAWRIQVDDNGRGIPPERRPAVFSDFERAAMEVEGHGIGLATTRRLVEAHGGRCGAEESAAGGASVWFELPA